MGFTLPVRFGIRLEGLWGGQFLISDDNGGWPFDDVLRRTSHVTPEHPWCIHHWNFGRCVFPVFPVFPGGLPDAPWFLLISAVEGKVLCGSANRSGGCRRRWWSMVNLSGVSKSRRGIQLPRNRCFDLTISKSRRFILRLQEVRTRALFQLCFDSFIEVRKGRKLFYLPSLGTELCAALEFSEVFLRHNTDISWALHFVRTCSNSKRLHQMHKHML